MSGSGADFFGRFLLLVLAIFYVIAIVRGFQLNRHGLRVHQPTRAASFGERMLDSLNRLVPTLRNYEIVASAWPLKFHLFPAALQTPLFDFWPLKLVGVLAWIGALTIYFLAQMSMGRHWRIGTATDAALVTSGAFAYSRHPIYLAFALMAVGTTMIFSSIGFFLLAGLSLALLQRQIIREEKALCQLHGRAYEDYCQRTSRYLTMRLRFKPNRHRS